MSIDKAIDMLLIKLSKKYKISIIEIRKYNEEFNRVTKSYTVNYENIRNKHSYNEKESFKSKRALVSWLSCLS